MIKLNQKFTIPIDKIGHNPYADIEITVSETIKQKVYTVFYYIYNEITGEFEGYDLVPQIVWTKNLRDNHIEAFDTIEDAKNIIRLYGYTLAHITDLT